MSESSFCDHGHVYGCPECPKERLALLNRSRGKSSMAALERTARRSTLGRRKPEVGEIKMSAADTQSVGKKGIIMNRPPKLIMTVGVPGSGKSFWSLEESQATGAVIINKDDIRLTLSQTGWTWSPKNEEAVIQMRDKQIIAALTSGKDVISSDTNLHPKHERDLRSIAGKYGATFEIKDFTQVPLETCLERNAKRVLGKVPEQVIRDMYKSIKPSIKVKAKVDLSGFRPYMPDVSKTKAILVDLDGTLSMFEARGHRGPYDAEKCDQDDVDPRVQYFLKLNLQYGDCKVIFVSGREDKFRPQTEIFLKRAGFYGFPLHMRASGDTRNDALVKLEIFDREIRDKYNVLMCLDDRQRVVDAYRSIGLVVWQVAPGQF